MAAAGPPAPLPASSAAPPQLNYTGAKNYTAVADCDETQSEVGMKLGGLLVIFLVYDVGLVRTGAVPMHCSALLGPLFILVTLCQTIAITIEMNDDFVHWPAGLKVTLADVSSWSLFLTHVNQVRKASFCTKHFNHFVLNKPVKVCQDRLGTNIANAENNKMSLLMQADGSEVVAATGASCGLIGPVGKLTLAMAAPFLCLASLIAYSFLFALIGAAAKLDMQTELPRIAKNVVTMMATVTTLFLLPYLRAVSAPQHCVSANIYSSDGSEELLSTVSVRD
jgi:hypothetical protein